MSHTPNDVDIPALVATQRTFFATGVTRDLAFRDTHLAALGDAVDKHEKHLIDALHADLRKSEAESQLTELTLIRSELRHARAHLKAWAKPSTWRSPVAAAPGTSRLVTDPLGPTLIIAPWNYPVLLSLEPLVPCLAAGNTAVVKPSEMAPATSEAVAALIRETFSPEIVACVEGGVDTSTALLEQPFDHVFFTGSPRVGKIVAKAAAEHLSRVTLELGGKSPCLVGPSANVDVAARRIALGKWINCGQTCVAPDYVLVHDSQHDALVDALRGRIRAMYGDDPKESPDYGRIVDARHHARLVGLMEGATIAAGGAHDVDDRYIAPTVLTDVSLDDAVMADEIFGPILPVIRISRLEEALGIIARHPNPLALYLFSEDDEEIRRVIERVPFGGGGVNQVITQMADLGVPFGGIRTSGQGAYHGHHGFMQFSHQKGVVHSSGSRWFDPELKYPPYGRELGLLKRLL